MNSLMGKKQEEERLRRYLFLGVEGTGILLTVFATPLIGIPIMAVGAYLGYKWFQYRAKNGMRF